MNTTASLSSATKCELHLEKFHTDGWTNCACFLMGDSLGRNRNFRKVSFRPSRSQSNVYQLESFILAPFLLQFLKNIAWIYIFWLNLLTLWCFFLQCLKFSKCLYRPSLPHIYPLKTSISALLIVYWSAKLESTFLGGMRNLILQELKEIFHTKKAEYLLQKLCTMFVKICIHTKTGLVHAVGCCKDKPGHAHVCTGKKSLNCRANSRSPGFVQCDNICPSYQRGWVQLWRVSTVSCLLAGV